MRRYLVSPFSVVEVRLADEVVKKTGVVPGFCCTECGWYEERQPDGPLIRDCGNEGCDEKDILVSPDIRPFVRQVKAALASTGPKTPEGKAKSAANGAWKGDKRNKTRYNALKHGAHLKSGVPPRRFDQYSLCNECEFHEGCEWSEYGDICIKMGATQLLTIKSLIDKDPDAFANVSAPLVGRSMALMQEMQAALSLEGVRYEEKMFNKDGDEVGSKTITNDLLYLVEKFHKTLGVTPMESVATRKSAGDSERGDKTVELFEGLMKGVGGGARGQAGNLPENDEGDGVGTDD